MECLDQNREDSGLHAWCFLPRDARWRRRDPWGDRLLITEGKTFYATDIVEMRRRHFDAWERPLDALGHAAGLFACRVLLSGTIEREGHARYYIVHGGGRVTTRRGMFRFLPAIREGVGRLERLYANEVRVLWTDDATDTLLHFACDLAERKLVSKQVAHREPDTRAWAMVIARRAWLKGALADEELRVAWIAVNSAWNEHWQRSPPDPRGRPMTEEEHQRRLPWAAHTHALSVVRYATEPVPLAAGRAVQNLKSAIGGGAWLPRVQGETQEQRIARLSLRADMINAELEQRLTNVGQSSH